MVDGLARAEAYIKAFRDDPLIVPAVAPHAMYTLDQATLVASAQLGRKYNVPVLIHLGADRQESRTFIRLKNPEEGEKKE